MDRTSSVCEHGRPSIAADSPGKPPSWFESLEDPDLAEMNVLRAPFRLLHLLQCRLDLVPVVRNRYFVQADMFGAGSLMTHYHNTRAVAHAVFRLDQESRSGVTRNLLAEVVRSLGGPFGTMASPEETLDVITHHVRASLADFESLVDQVRRAYWNAFDQGCPYLPKPRFGVRPDGSSGKICQWPRCTRWAVRPVRGEPYCREHCRMAS